MPVGRAAAVALSPSFRVNLAMALLSVRMLLSANFTNALKSHCIR